MDSRSSDRNPVTPTPEGCSDEEDIRRIIKINREERFLYSIRIKDGVGSSLCFNGITIGVVTVADQTIDLRPLIKHAYDAELSYRRGENIADGTHLDMFLGAANDIITDENFDPAKYTTGIAVFRVRDLDIINAGPSTTYECKWSSSTEEIDKLPLSDKLIYMQSRERMINERAHFTDSGIRDGGCVIH